MRPNNSPERAPEGFKPKPAVREDLSEGIGDRMPLHRSDDGSHLIAQVRFAMAYESCSRYLLNYLSKNCGAANQSPRLDVLDLPLT